MGYAVDLIGVCGGEKLKLSTPPWNTGMRRVCEALGFMLKAYLRGEYLGEDLAQCGYFPEGRALSGFSLRL